MEREKKRSEIYFCIYGLQVHVYVSLCKIDVIFCYFFESFQSDIQSIELEILIGVRDKYKCSWVVACLGLGEVQDFISF